MADFNSAAPEASTAASSHIENQPDFYFSNLLAKMADTSATEKNTEYFKTKHREYSTTAEAQFMRHYAHFLRNKRRWEEIAIMDVEAKRRKTELDKVIETIAILEDERAVKQLRYERAVKRVTDKTESMLRSINAEAEGGIMAFAHSTRECVICRETKCEMAFVWNVVCSHSTCFTCLKKSRESGVKTCMVCRAKQPSSSFIILCESQGCRFIVAPM